MGTDGNAVVEQTTEETSTVKTEAVEAEVQLKEQVQPTVLVAQKELVQDSATVSEEKELVAAVVEKKTAEQEEHLVQESKSAAAETVTEEETTKSTIMESEPASSVV